MTQWDGDGIEEKAERVYNVKMPMISATPGCFVKRKSPTENKGLMSCSAFEIGSK